MKFLHYSAEPFQFDRDRKYDDKHGFKPGGLWLSVEGDDDWRSWCEGEQWGLGGLKHVVEVTLKPDANVLVIDTPEKLEAFNARFGGSDPYDLRSIKWGQVKALYDGMIIAPYQWQHRLGLMWYYGWDCASGVIWNLSAVATVTPASDILPPASR
jgi:hypothetical protein